jgi:hypothetical protein
MFEITMKNHSLHLRQDLDRPKTLLATVAGVALFVACTTAQPEASFTSLFDGKTLNGWKGAAPQGGGYGVTNGVIYCGKDGRNLYTEKQYADFVLRIEFKLEDGSNNGIGIRAPAEGDAAYSGMEIQILEDRAADRGKWGKLRPAQYHGSIYDVVPAKRDALKPPASGTWRKSPRSGGTFKWSLMARPSPMPISTRSPILKSFASIRVCSARAGISVSLGHGDYLEFRNIWIKELPPSDTDNTPPKGFTALFNGKNLDGWKGLMKPPLDNPIKRAALTPEERGAAQKQADEDIRGHWKVENGEIVFDGKARSLCTMKDYANFEMLVDWKIPPHGDSGIYLRGSPQVQIWDPFTKPTKAGSEVGSGAFYNNQKNPSKPLKVADKPIGEWNRFRILMSANMRMCTSTANSSPATS